MKPHEDKIKFYARRTMGENINAAFDYVRENLRPWLRCVVMVLLPVCIVQSVGYVNIMEETVSPFIGSGNDATVMSTLITMLAWGVGSWLLTALIMALLRLYNDRPDGLESVTWHDWLPLLWRNSLRLLWLFVPMGVLLGSMGLLYYMPVLIGMVMVVGPFVMLPLVLMPVVLLMDETRGVWNVVGKCFKLGFAQYGTLLGIMFTMTVATMVMSGAVTIPWTVCLYAKRQLLGNALSAGLFVQIAGGVLFNIMTVLLCLFNYLAMSMVLLSVSYLYGSMAAQVDDAAIESEIDDFENL